MLVNFFFHNNIDKNKSSYGPFTIFGLSSFNVWLLDHSIVLKARNNGLFYESITLHIHDYSNVRINSSHSINVLGVLFDSRLQWNNQVAQSITKAKNIFMH